VTEQPPSESPITTHNRKLAFDVMKKTNTFSRYPRVSEQVECLPLETGKLHKFGYNPALNTKGWLAYRYHVTRLGTRLAVAQLGENGSVVLNRALPIEGKSVDDAKLFTHAGQDFISWVEATWNDADYQNTIRCVVKYGKFDGAVVTDVKQPMLPGNDGSTLQKNYVFFTRATNGGESAHLHCIYQCHPTQKIYDLTGFKGHSAFEGAPIYETEAPQWPYGHIRGDTAPLPYEGKLLRFFHSRLSNETAYPFFRYYIGAVLHEPDPPFEVVRVSKRPVVFGSEISAQTAKTCPHFKPNVCFGGSAIETNGGWILPIGVNDSECVLARITPEQLNF
jgi:hypothetical protein